MPKRILALTGTGVAASIAATIDAARSGLRISSLPQPLSTIFLTGQPMLRSKATGR